MSRPRRDRREPSRDVTVSKALSYLLRHAAEREGLKMNSQGYANVADVLAWKKIKSLKVTLPEILHAVDSSDKKRFALLHIPSASADTSKEEATTEPTKSTVPDGTHQGPASAEDDSSKVLGSAPSTSQEQQNSTAHALSVEDTDPSHFLIRATQGHSIKTVDAASFLERLSLSDDAPETAKALPDTVVHGTYHAAWPAILASGGLRCMSRNHVHFATGPSLESIMPEGRDGQVKLLDSRKDLQNGHVISGMRRDAQVLIYINLKKALEAGCPFWRSENGVILSEGMDTGESNGKGAKQKVVPLEFFDVVVERKAGLGVLYDNGKVVQELPAELAGKPHPKGKRVDPRGARGTRKEARKNEENARN
ncbi:tRNA 2'-phosphotransferase [Paecilomyces lecythidis]